MGLKVSIFLTGWVVAEPLTSGAPPTPLGGVAITFMDSTSDENESIAGPGPQTSSRTSGYFLFGTSREIQGKLLRFTKDGYTPAFRTIPNGLSSVATYSLGTVEMERAKFLTFMMTLLKVNGLECTSGSQGGVEVLRVRRIAELSTSERRIEVVILEHKDCEDMQATLDQFVAKNARAGSFKVVAHPSRRGSDSTDPARLLKTRMHRAASTPPTVCTCASGSERRHLPRVSAMPLVSATPSGGVAGDVTPP